MSWIARAVEKQLADAAAAGELEPPHLKGKPIPGIDEQRAEGWWAQQFVQRELSHDRRKVAADAADRARVDFWKSADPSELRERVGDANQQIARANINLTPADQIELFDPIDIRQRWDALHRGP